MKLRRKSGIVDFFEGKGRFFNVGWYNNTTNVSGSVFLHLNFHFWKLFCWAKIDWFKWPEFGDRERGIEVSWSVPFFGNHVIKITWKQNQLVK